MIAGLYRWHPAPDGRRARGDDPVLRHLVGRPPSRPSDELAEHYGVGAELWSATCYQQLRMEALEVERWNRLHPGRGRLAPRWVTEHAVGSAGTGRGGVATACGRCPTRSAAGCRRRPSLSLGTDGFGRSDTREALRRFFETDAPHVVLTVLSELVAAGALVPAALTDAIERYGIETERAAPWLD